MIAAIPGESYRMKDRKKADSRQAPTPGHPKRPRKENDDTAAGAPPQEMNA
jgi:hypothetical protein